MEDPRTKALFAEALQMAAIAARDAKPPGFVGTLDTIRLSAAQVTATATIFAALVENDLANQIRAIRAEAETSRKPDQARPVIS